MPSITLTRAQSQWRARLMAWVNGQDTQATFSIQEVFERYVPPDVKGAGQYFTSVEMGTAALQKLQVHLTLDRLRVLDPCAGIGHFLYLLRLLRDWAIFDAYEVEEECVQVGRKLFPWVNWSAQMPFTTIKEIEGRYDLVVCNPPIGARRGVAMGKQMCAGRCARSEYIFLELSIRALKAGGQAIVLGPEAYLERQPAGLRAWLEEHAVLDDRFGPLPGGAGPMALYAHYFTRKGEPQFGLPVIEVIRAGAPLFSQIGTSSSTGLTIPQRSQAVIFPNGPTYQPIPTI